MPAENRIFQGDVLRCVRGRGSRTLRCKARSSIPVASRQRFDKADESVGVTEFQEWGFHFGKRLDKAFEPIAGGASLFGRERRLERRIRIDVAAPVSTLPTTKPPSPASMPTASR